MTAIIGIVSDGKAWIGGDSAGVSGCSVSVRADEKVFINGPYIFGFTTSFRMGQLLRYSLIAPVPERDENLDKFMATKFVNAVRECLKSGGFASKTNENESGGSFIVGYKKFIYAVHQDYQVERTRSKVIAVGCGADFALGSIYSTQKMAPFKRIWKALSAAENFSNGVRRPFVIMNTGMAP